MGETEDNTDARDAEGEQSSSGDPSDASRFGGEHTAASEELSPAESWDDDAEDIDALLKPSEGADSE